MEVVQIKLCSVFSQVNTGISSQCCLPFHGITIPHSGQCNGQHIVEKLNTIACVSETMTFKDRCGKENPFQNLKVSNSLSNQPQTQFKSSVLMGAKILCGAHLI